LIAQLCATLCNNNIAEQNSKSTIPKNTDHLFSGLNVDKPISEAVTLLIIQILGLFAALLIGSIVLIPRLLHVGRLWKSKGSVEGIVTASFFGAAGIAAVVGLSPIVGAFAVGMAVASTRLIKQVDEYAEKLLITFGPLFFAIIGAQVDLRGINLN
jgi:Kef-type K+ transport system membrane component KefB